MWICVGPHDAATKPSRGRLRVVVTLHRALRRMASLVFLLVFWVLAGACQRHGVGVFLIVQYNNNSKLHVLNSRRVVRFLSEHGKQKQKRHAELVSFYSESCKRVSGAVFLPRLSLGTPG